MENSKSNTKKVTIEHLDEILRDNLSKEIDSILSSGSLDDRLSRLLPLFTLAIDGALSNSQVNDIPEEELNENLFSLSECWHEIRRLIQHRQEEYETIWKFVRHGKFPENEVD